MADMAEIESNAPPRQRFGQRATLGCLFFMALAVGLLFLVAQVLLRPRAMRHATQESIRHVLIAFQNYEDIMRHFPPANVTDSTGLPIGSWRFGTYWALTSPGGVNYIGFGAPEFKEPWTSPGNAWMVGSIPKCYRPYEDVELPFTKILAIVGPGTAFDAGPQITLADLDPDTILIVEVNNSGLHWMEPGDLDIRIMPRAINHPSGKGIAGVNPDEFNVGFADGKVWCLRSDVPFEELEKFFTIESAKRFDRDQVLAPYRVNE